MKLALLGDIHANAPALSAVLDDARSRGCRRVLNTGDTIGYGADPEEVTQRIADDAEILSILGNYDRKVLHFAKDPSNWPKPKSPAKYFAFQWAYRQLSPAGRGFLSMLPQERRVEFDGVRILMVHGSPDDDQEKIDEDTPPERLETLARMAHADVVVFGHTHRTFDREIHGVRFLNAGSVGRQDDGDPRARYAVLEIVEGELRVEFLRIAYDVQEQVHRIHQQGLPEAFAEMMRRGLDLKHALREMTAATAQDVAPDVDEAPRLAKIRELAEHCRYEQPHAEQVTRLALRLFDDLQPLHGLGKQARFLLRSAGLLHDIGWVEGQKKHHKMARDIILHAESLPLTPRERSVVALVARYHRRALPKKKHTHYAAMQEGDRHTVRTLAGLLRLADGLDRSHEALVRDVLCRWNKRRLTVFLRADITPVEERSGGRKKADLLSDVIGREVRVELAGKDEDNE
jgi:putative phosphoesterase